MEKLLQHIVNHDHLHAKWLNTLSFLENAGAKKISRCEHSEEVNIIQLKHAAEEHRHAYYLKRLIGKTGVEGCTAYRENELLNPRQTRRYLHCLDVRTCSYLKKTFGLQGSALKFAAYLFVTYAIEVRADALYPVYQRVLQKSNHTIKVRFIIAEEEGHLQEMVQLLEKFSSEWEKHALHISILEQELYNDWMKGISQEVYSYE
jgi:hypothetical protein